VLCALFALVNLYLFVTYSSENYHLGICIWLSKVYSNSMMVVLNSRAHIGHDLPDATNRSTEVVLSYGTRSAALQVAVETTRSATVDFSTGTLAPNFDKQDFGV
jgi:hypothetical protein